MSSTASTSTTTIEIQPRQVVVPILAGSIASLWSIIPFLLPGTTNLLPVTLLIGLAISVLALPRSKKIAVSGSLIVFALISFLLVPISAQLLYPPHPASNSPQPGSEIIVLDVPDMFCQGCSYAVTTALEGMPGVLSADVNLDQKKATVEIDPARITAETILSNPVIQGYGGKLATN